MPAILRIDVDRAYENRILHYLRVNQELFPVRDSLEYLESCKEVVNDLNSRGLKASVFFQPFTVPNKEFAQELIKRGHSVGLQEAHTKDYKDFSSDLNRISKSFDGKIYGVIKHSSVINFDDSERSSSYKNTGFVINAVPRRFVYGNI